MQKTEKRILLLLTGGTFASTEQGDGLKPTLTADDIFPYISKALCGVSVEVDSVFRMDSSDMQAAHWTALAQRVRQSWKDFEGFVIVHGTDTLTYTAAALGMLLGEIDKPVALTGAQLPLKAAGSDAVSNLHDALQVACFSPARGVSVVFHGKIFDAFHTRKADTQKMDAFESFNFPLLGTVSGSAVRLNRPAPLSPFHFTDAVSDQVAMISVSPTLSPKVALAAGNGCKALVLECYGLGGIPHRLVPVLTKLNEQGTIVAAVTRCPKGRTDLSVYEVGHAAISAGVQCVSGVPAETVCVLLSCLLAENRTPAQRIDALQHWAAAMEP